MEGCFRRLLSDKFRNRQLASLFLDQSFLAGIGNYLRSEILFDARANPLKKPKELALKSINQISRSTLKICQRAYTENGVTNPERLVRKLKLLGLSRSAYRHAVFGRSGKKCHTCKTSIEKVSIGSRRLYLCPPMPDRKLNKARRDRAVISKLSKTCKVL